MAWSSKYTPSLSGTAFLGLMIRAVSDLAKALRHRREVMRLAEFDDRMLKDIGLVRSDVEGALAESLLCNPSLVLVRRTDRSSVSSRMDAPARKLRPIVPSVKPAGGCA